MSQLLRRVEALLPLAEALCRALREEVRKLGFADASIIIPGPDAATYRFDRDPALGTDCLVGEWRDSQGQRCGMLLFHADGSFFAEHDVIQLHPANPRWFVEAVNAWGRDGDIRAEPRLMPMVS
jgi:hypothetical protein